MAQWLGWPPITSRPAVSCACWGSWRWPEASSSARGASTRSEVTPFGPSSEGNDFEARLMRLPDSVREAHRLSAQPSACLRGDAVLARLVNRRGSASDTPGQGAQQLVGPTSEAGIQTGVPSAACVWFSSFDSEIEECRALGSMHPPAMDWVADGLTATEAHPFSGLSMLHDVRQERGRP